MTEELDNFNLLNVKEEDDINDKLEDNTDDEFIRKLNAITKNGIFQDINAKRKQERNEKLEAQLQMQEIAKTINWNDVPF